MLYSETSGPWHEREEARRRREEREHFQQVCAERDRYRDALEEIRDGLGPHRERLSSQQAKNAYDTTAAALGDAEQATRTNQNQRDVEGSEHG